jgi:hypothetical protein
MRSKLVRSLCLGWLAAAAPACAAEPDDADVGTVTQAKSYFGITSADLDCPPSPVDGSIIVCGRRKVAPRIDPPEGTTTTTQPDSKMIGLGSPPIPPRPPGVTIKGCFLQKCPKKLYFLDVSALPKAPPGSDADKISRGEMRAP